MAPHILVLQNDNSLNKILARILTTQLSPEAEVVTVELRSEALRTLGSNRQSFDLFITNVGSKPSDVNTFESFIRVVRNTDPHMKIMAFTSAGSLSGMVVDSILMKNGLNQAQELARRVRSLLEKRAA
jgi:two-component SAPR family response regulator